MTGFAYSDLLPLGHDDTDYRLMSADGVSHLRSVRPQLPEG